MSSPLELLLGVQEAGEIDRRVFVAEELRRGRPERVDGGERRRHAVRRVGADGARKRVDTLALDLEAHRRIRPAGDNAHGKKTNRASCCDPAGGSALARGAPASAAAPSTPP